LGQMDSSIPEAFWKAGIVRKSPLPLPSDIEWRKLFEKSWIDNGWDAAFAAGRQAGELQLWLRDYDPRGTAGEWKTRAAEPKKPKLTREL